MSTCTNWHNVIGGSSNKKLFVTWIYFTRVPRIQVIVKIFMFCFVQSKHWHASSSTYNFITELQTAVKALTLSLSLAMLPNRADAKVGSSGAQIKSHTRPSVLALVQDRRKMGELLFACELSRVMLFCDTWITSDDIFTVRTGFLELAGLPVSRWLVTLLWLNSRNYKRTGIDLKCAEK